MIYFPDTMVERYTYTTTNGGVYGESIGIYQEAGVIIVDFQNEGNNEIAKEYGVELRDLFKIYLDMDTPLNESDRLFYNGDLYEIIGGIQEYHHIQYKRAHLIRIRRGKH